MDEARPSIGEAEVLVTYGEDMDEAIVEECQKLRFVQVISAGLELMPLEALHQRGIAVANARGIHATPMSEYVMGALLSLVRQFDSFRDLQRRNTWDRSIRVGELAGKCLLVVGAGAIGQAIAQKAQAFGMRVLGVNTSGRARTHFDRMFSQANWREALPEADFVVLTVPLTEKTRKMVGEAELYRMKPSSHLINIARGAVVDELALIRALREKRIAGAVLDVFEQEPLPSSHPFWQMPEVVLTPHVSGRSPWYMTRAMKIFHHNLQVYLQQEGSYLNLIEESRDY